MVGLFALAKIALSISLVSGALLLAALLFRKQNPVANRLLAALITLSVVRQLLCAAYFAGLAPHYHVLYRSDFPFALLSPALLFLYVKAFTAPTGTLERRDLWHLLPGLFGFLWYAAFFLLVHDADFWTDSPALSLERYVRTVLFSILTAGYLWLGFQRLNAFASEGQNYVSSSSMLRLHWLRVLLVLAVGLWAIVVVDVLTGPYVPLWEVQPFAATLALFAVAVFALRQAPLFLAEEVHDREAAATGAPKCSDAELERCAGKLADTVMTKHPHLNPELRLAELANEAGMKSYQLSELLNRRMGTTFFQYVNGLRVDEAKKRLAAPEFRHFSILAIAEESGFKSKSVFNKTFREVVGHTPSEYRTTHGTDSTSETS